MTRQKKHIFIYQKLLETMAATNETCILCNKSGRHDNIIRHIATHKKQIHSLMDANNIKHCVDNKLPLLFVRGKIVYCLICHKYSITNMGIKSFVDSYKHLHSKCIGKFDSVSQHYYCADTTVNLFETTEPPCNVIVSQPDAAPPVNSKYTVSPELFEKLSATMEYDDDEETDQLSIDDMIECLLARVSMRQRRIDLMEKQIKQLQSNPKPEKSE